jgi:ubiquinol-cytochrome c reductase cytochrome b subunit
VPIIGTWAHWALFGGEFPGTEIIPRLYIVHVLILPGVLLALIGLHVGLVWYQKHTQYPGPGRTEKNVVGVRILPVFAAKGGAFFAVCAGIMAMMGGIFQINPIWNLGPYNPAQISSGRSPTSTCGSARAWPACSRPGRSSRELPDPAAFWPTAGVPAAAVRRRRRSTRRSSGS